MNQDIFRSQEKVRDSNSGRNGLAPDDVGAGRAIATAQAVNKRTAQNKITNLFKRVRESGA
jgi:hypothetical protein